MNSSKPSSRPPAALSPLSYSLRATRFRIRLAELGAALLLMLAVGVVGCLAIIVADHVVSGGLSLWTRWTLRWILIGVEAVLLAVLVLFPLLRRISSLYAARQMEQADPSFHNDLTAALQLDGKTGPAAATAAAVRRSASRQAARMANGAPMQKRSLRLASLAAGGAILVFCLYWSFAPKSTVASLQRAVGVGNPPPPTRTQLIRFTPPDGTVVLTGEEVIFEARLQNPLGPAVLSIARDAHTVLDEDVLTMTPIDEPGPGEAYRVAWKAAAADEWAKFRLTCGDAESPWRQIRVLPTPALRRVKVRCDWPKYTGIPPQRSEGGRVEGPVGTQATVTAEANLPVLRATLVFEADGRTLVMTPDATGRFFAATFRVNQSGSYVIHYELRDIDVEAKSIPHEVVVTPDQPPSLRLDRPAAGEDTALAENESLSVLGEVTDDFGVGEVQLVSKDQHGLIKSHPLWQQKQPGASSRQLRSSIQAGTLGRAGDTLTCVVQVRDQNPSAEGGGQVTQSKPFTVTITPPQTTAEQQEAAGGEGLADDTQAKDGQGELAMVKGDSDRAQPDVRKTLSQIEEQQPDDQEGVSESSGQTQPGDEKETDSDDSASPVDPQDAKKLDQLCDAMQKEENKVGDKGSSDKSNEDDSIDAKVDGESEALSNSKEEETDSGGTDRKIDLKSKNMPSDRDKSKKDQKRDEHKDSPDEDADTTNLKDKTNVKGEIPSRMTSKKANEEISPSEEDKKEEEEKQLTKTGTVKVKPKEGKAKEAKESKCETYKREKEKKEEEEEEDVKTTKKKNNSSARRGGGLDLPKMPQAKIPSTQPVKKKKSSSGSPGDKEDSPKQKDKSQRKVVKKEVEQSNNTKKNEEKNPGENQSQGDKVEAELKKNEQVNKTAEMGDTRDSSEKKPGISGGSKGKGLIGSRGKKDESKKGESTKDGGKKSDDKKNNTSQNKGKQNESGKKQPSSESKNAGKSKSTEPKPAGTEKKNSVEPKESSEGKTKKKETDTQTDDEKNDGTKQGKSSQTGKDSQGSTVGEKGQSPQPSQTAGQGQQQQDAQPQENGSQNPAGARNVHDKTRPGAGTEQRDGELLAVDENALMPGTTQPLESVGRALERARRQIEDDTVDPKLLEAMSMSLPEFKNFVEKYTDEYKKALHKRENQKQTVRVSPPEGPTEVQHGVESNTGNVTADAGLEKQRTEKDRRMTPAAVSPEYQKQLEAYRRAVSEGQEK